MLRFCRHAAPLGLVRAVLKRTPAVGGLGPSRELWPRELWPRKLWPRKLWLGAALLSIAGVWLSGCSKEETPPETIPFKEATAEPASNNPDDSDADGSDDGDAPEPEASAAEPTAVQPPKPAGKSPAGKAPLRTGASIDNCCGALSTQARIAKEPAQVARYKQASRVCYSISKLVKAGKTSRSSALRQVRAVAGNAVPGNCR